MCIAGLAGIGPIIGALTSILGAVVGAAGQMQAADAQAKQYEAQSRQMQAEAAAQEYQVKQQRMIAADAVERGTQEEAAARRKTDALAGRQRAVLAASNLDLGSGSPLAILGDTAMLGEYDAQVIRGNAQREGQYSQVNANLGAFSAANTRQGAQDVLGAADDARTAGSIAAFGTILGGISSVAGKWYTPSSSSGSTGTGFKPAKIRFA
jgi:hypothetical protein